MHSFVVTVPIGPAVTSIQVAYPSHQIGDEHLSVEMDTIVEDYNRRLVPGRLLFVCPNPMAERLQRCFEARRAHYERRLQSVSHVAVAPFDQRGTLVPKDVVNLRASDAPWLFDDKFLLDLAKTGVSALFDATETILYPPHGYAFRKPSGREEDIFVRAGNMLRQPEALPIFNHILLRHLPSNCTVLCIDSFTILSFAMDLQSAAGYFDLPALAIKSFHSYDITPEVWIPNEKNYMVLISASTSGGLAQKLAREYQAEPSRIVHLLGVGSAGASFRDSCIHFHERDAKEGAAKTPGQTNATIEIRTEEFLVSQGAPRPVRITKGHVDRNAAKELHRPFYRRALQFGGSALGRSYSPFSMSSDMEHADSSPLRKWATRRLVNEIPASVRTLLHVGDGMAKQMAKWIAGALGSDVELRDLNEFDPCSVGAGPSNAIAVIAHDDPELEHLTRASIALRQLPDNHRHFVVGYAFPSSRGEYKRRRADLMMAANRRDYGWSEFLVLPVGAAVLHDSFAMHRSVLGSNAMKQCSSSLGTDLYNAFVRQRTSTTIVEDSLFLPRTNGTQLALRQGSVFLPESSPDVSQIAVYAMVAGAVQSAREPSAARAPATPGFDDNPFVRAVLDPSMFSRYSDGILQASLLRSTQRSELDYSGSDDLSRRFVSTCSSVLLNHANPVGEAAPEFIYALATRKVVLREADHKRVLDAIASVPVLRAIFKLFGTVDPISEHLGD